MQETRNDKLVKNVKATLVASDNSDPGKRESCSNLWYNCTFLYKKSLNEEKKSLNSKTPRLRYMLISLKIDGVDFKSVDFNNAF